MSGQKEVFFNEKNEGMLQRVLYSDICRRTGGDLSERQAERLIKTVKHYMGEVYRVKGDSSTVGVMNKEVLQVVLPDYMMYVERTARSSGRSVISDIEIGPASPSAAAEPVIAGAITDGGRMDLDTAFSKLQSSRQQGTQKPPAPTDFRISLQNEGPVPMDVFERIKQDRQDEAIRQTALVPSQGAALAPSQGQGAYAAATDNFARSRRRAEEESEAAFAEAERRQLESRAAASRQSQASLPEPPDMRALLLGNTQNLDRARQTYEEPAVPTRQQMMITREPSTIEYKESELNLFVYSGDRDWASTSSTETRYNFSVAFNPNNTATGLRLTPASTAKFRNIVRIELVKAIMPGESLDNVVTRTFNGTSFAYDSPYNMNILSFPYIQVRIPELDTNTYGTNLGLNASFGVLQYDANWVYDTSNDMARGYFAMIPKFLKCQKVYSPTPLTTLQRLSFRFERPDGSLLSAVSDTLDIAEIRSSKEFVATAAMPYGYDSSVENGSSAAYYFLKTKTYFNTYTVSKGDRILMQNFLWNNAPVFLPALNQLTDLTNYLSSSSGFIVVDTGCFVDGALTLGANKQGYCNCLVVRGKYEDPTTGITKTIQLGNASDTAGSSSATFRGTIAGTVLTVNSISFGVLSVGMTISGLGVNLDTNIPTRIVSLGTGVGGIGTYNLNNSSTVSTEQEMNAGASFGAIFTGSISGSTLTVTSITSGTLSVGMMLSGLGVQAGTFIQGINPGTTGGTGSYELENSQTVGSVNMTAGAEVTASFTGTISNTTLTIPTGGMTSGSLSVGMLITGPGVSTGTTIVTLGTGTGGQGTYTLSTASSVTSPVSMTALPNVTASFMGYISGTTLHIPLDINLSMFKGSLYSGMVINGPGIATGTFIVSQISGAAGGLGYTGQYTLNISQTVGTSSSFIPITASIDNNTITPFLAATSLTTGRLLNQSHQVQIALRVITRDLDSTSVIRPDNL
jgi:hypothetical protein